MLVSFVSLKWCTKEPWFLNFSVYYKKLIKDILTNMLLISKSMRRSNNCINRSPTNCDNKQSRVGHGPSVQITLIHSRLEVGDNLFTPTWTETILLIFLLLWYWSVELLPSTSIQRCVSFSRLSQCVNPLPPVLPPIPFFEKYRCFFCFLLFFCRSGAVSCDELLWWGWWGRLQVCGRGWWWVREWWSGILRYFLPSSSFPSFSSSSLPSPH